MHCLDGAGRWARMGDVMRDAVVTGGAVLVQGGHDGRALAAARQEWAAWLSSGAGGRITPSGSHGGAVDIREFVGSEAGSGWFKTFGLGTDDRGDEGPVVRWADTGLGRGAHWLRRARQHMRGAGVEGIHVDASVREVTFMASGSPPDSGEVHFDEFDSLSVVVHGGKTWFFLADADMTREYGAHPGAGPVNERLDVVPDTGRGWRRMRQEAGDVVAVPLGVWHSVVSDPGTNAVGEWHRRERDASGRPRGAVSSARAWFEGAHRRTMGRAPPRVRAPAGPLTEGDGCIPGQAAGPGATPSLPASPPESDGEQDEGGDGARTDPVGTQTVGGGSGTVAGGAPEVCHGRGAPRWAGAVEGVTVMAEVVAEESSDARAEGVIDMGYAEVVDCDLGGEPEPNGRGQVGRREFNWRDWGRQGGAEASGWPQGLAAATLSGERFDGLTPMREWDNQGLPVISTGRRVRPTGQMDDAGRHLRIHRHDTGAQERWRQAAGDVPRETRMVEGLDEMRAAVYECSRQGCEALVPARTRHEGRGCTAAGCVKKKNYRPGAHVSTQLDRVGMLRRGERALMQRLPSEVALGWEQQSEMEMLRAATNAERAAVAAATRPAGGKRPWGGGKGADGAFAPEGEGGSGGADAHEPSIELCGGSAAHGVSGCSVCGGSGGWAPGGRLTGMAELVCGAAGGGEAHVRSH